MIVERPVLNVEFRCDSYILSCFSSNSPDPLSGRSRLTELDADGQYRSFRI